MARSVDEVELVLLPVLGVVVDADGLGLDGDAPLALQVHAVEHLLAHVALGDGVGHLQDAVGQRRLPVVDVGDDAEVADVIEGGHQGGYSSGKGGRDWRSWPGGVPHAHAKGQRLHVYEKLDRPALRVVPCTFSISAARLSARLTLCGVAYTVCLLQAAWSTMRLSSRRNRNRKERRDPELRCEARVPMWQCCLSGAVVPGIAMPLWGVGNGEAGVCPDRAGTRRSSRPVPLRAGDASKNDEAFHLSLAARGRSDAEACVSGVCAHSCEELAGLLHVQPSPNDDIVAAHFARTDDGSNCKPSGLTHLISRRVDINKALTRLTYTRVATKPLWPFHAIRREIQEAYREFLEQLPEDKQTRWQG